MSGNVPAQRPSWTRRVGWLLLIWALSVLALGFIAAVIRIAMTAVGLTA